MTQYIRDAMDKAKKVQNYNLGAQQQHLSVADELAKIGKLKEQGVIPTTNSNR